MEATASEFERRKSSRQRNRRVERRGVAEKRMTVYGQGGGGGGGAGCRKGCQLAGFPGIYLRIYNWNW